MKTSMKLTPLALAVATLIAAPSALASQISTSPATVPNTTANYENFIHVEIKKHIESTTTSYIQVYGGARLFASAQAVSDTKQLGHANYSKSIHHTNALDVSSSYNGNRGIMNAHTVVGDLNQVEMANNIAVSNSLLLPEKFDGLRGQAIAKFLSGMGRVDAESFNYQEKVDSFALNKGSKNTAHIHDSYSRNRGLVNAVNIVGQQNQANTATNIAKGPGAMANADSGSIQSMDFVWTANKPLHKREVERKSLELDVWLEQAGSASGTFDLVGTANTAIGDFGLLGDGNLTLSGIELDGTINLTLRKVTHELKGSRNNTNVTGGSFSQNRGAGHTMVSTGNMNQLSSSINIAKSSLGGYGGGHSGGHHTVK